MSASAPTAISAKGDEPRIPPRAVLEVRENSYMRTFAAGIRNPVGLAYFPGSERLWTVVSERDMLAATWFPTI